MAGKPMKVMLARADLNLSIVTPPLGLGYIASFLERAGHEVKLVDCLLRNMSAPGFLDAVWDWKPDVLCLPVMTCSYAIVKRLVSAVKSEFPDMPVILGGPHASALPEFCLDDSAADAVVIGEGEITLLELLDAGMDFGGVSGLAYRKGGKRVTLNGPREPISDLDLLPFPAWHLMPPAGYPKAPHGFFVKNFPVAPIVTSRGCPYDCSFCASNRLWGRRFRTRSPENVADEIELLVSSYGVREIHIEDDNFTLVKKRAIGICDEILKRKIKIDWACPNGVRIDTLDTPLLRTMRKAGCYLLAFGIESGSQKVLNAANKRLDLGIVSRVVEKAKREGMETWGFFMLGLPGETADTLEETIEYAKRLKLDRAQFAITTPIPGSALWDEWSRGKDLRSMDWEKMNYFQAGCSVGGGIAARELEAARARGHREFYLRPGPMLNFLSRIKPSQFRILMERAKSYFGL